MNFTYKSYAELIELLGDNNYSFADYHSYGEYERCVILRHDIDQSPKAALKIAETEAKKNVRSTYFVLLSTDLYNIASKAQLDTVMAIRSMGHSIGLHFDEVVYSEGNVCDLVRREADILSDILQMKIDVVSMHRPSANTLEADYNIPDMINSYSKLFFKEFKYLSDSRCRWREPVEEIIRSGEYSRLHILTHPFWYGETERTAAETIERFVNHANTERYESMSENIRDLSELMTGGQVK